MRCPKRITEHRKKKAAELIKGGQGARQALSPGICRAEKTALIGTVLSR
jgi:hypothetical protein